jgi:exopolysaccharide biosynthesis polyprenyl glycosylphosphotransferase
MNKSLKQIILLLGDVAILHLALLISLAVRYINRPMDSLWLNNWPYFIPVFGIWIIILYIVGAYNLNLVYKSRLFKLTIINSVIFAALVSVIYFYLIKSDISPKTILLIFVVVFGILFYLWRSVFNFFVKSYLPKNNLAFIGWNNDMASLLEDVKNQPHQGYETALVFKTKEEIGNLAKVIKEKNIHTLVLTSELFNDPKLSQALFECISLGVAFYTFVDFYESINGKVPIEAIDQAWFITNLSESNKRSFNIFKRGFDVILSLAILLISLVFWPFIALAIKLNSRGPVFFKQIRVGENEETFQMLKFRTMKTIDNDGGMTQKNDNRITSFGNFLRKTRIDEIPQMINILRSDMSFIGPRPERPEYVAELAAQIPFYKTRLLTKPGLSGWDQISGVYHSPSLKDTTEKLQYDLYYLKHRSLYFDIAIFLKTVATVIGRQGR